MITCILTAPETSVACTFEPVALLNMLGWK